MARCTLPSSGFSRRAFCRAILTLLTLVSLTPSGTRAQSLTPPVSAPAAPGDLVNAFHAAFGDHHARAVHTKGISLEDEFAPDPQAATLTKANHLQKEPSRVVVRFSDFTGLPAIPDNTPSASPRGLAVKFLRPDGTSTDVVCHTFNGFPVSTNDDFRLLLLSIAASGSPTAAKPTAFDRFLDAHRAPAREDISDDPAAARELGDGRLLRGQLLQVHQLAG